MGQIPESVEWKMSTAGSWHGEWLIFKFDAIQEGAHWHLVLSNGSLSVAGEQHKTLTECRDRAFSMLRHFLKCRQANDKFYLSAIPDG